MPRGTVNTIIQWYKTNRETPKTNATQWKTSVNLRNRRTPRTRHRMIRQEWCKPRRFWTVDDHWSRVTFSDESMINVGDNYRVHVWKRKGEDYRPDLYGERTIQSNHVSKLWYGSAFTWYGIGTLSFVDSNIDAEKYLDTLEENSWPVIARHFPRRGEIFQDDGAPVHTANIVKTWKRNSRINTLPCPPAPTPPLPPPPPPLLPRT